MMNKVIFVALGAFVLAGCSATQMKDDDVGIMERPTEVVDKPPTQIGNLVVPAWYLELPEDSQDRIYAVGTGLSDDMQFSMDKAIHSAKVSLGDKIAARSSAELKTFISDNGKGSQGITSRKSQKVAKSGFKDIDVSKYIIEHSAVQKEDSYYRTYIQLSLDPSNRQTEIVNTYNPQDEVIANQAMDNL